MEERACKLYYMDVGQNSHAKFPEYVRRYIVLPACNDIHRAITCTSYSISRFSTFEFRPTGVVNLILVVCVIVAVCR